MKREDWQKAYTPKGDALEKRVQNTLSGLKEARGARSKTRWIVALAALPLFRPDWYLTADADVFSAWYEAVRRTLLENGEFPFWNPWSHGGVPLFANPQVAVLGLETLTTILTGAWRRRVGCIGAAAA